MNKENNVMNVEEVLNHENGQKAFAQQVEEGGATGKWMGAMFTIEPNGDVTLRKTTSNFPTGEFWNCLRLLKEMLEKEMGIAEDSPTPLKIAPQFQTRSSDAFEAQPFPGAGAVLEKNELPDVSAPQNESKSNYFDNFNGSD